MKTRTLALTLTAFAAVTSQAQIKQTWSMYNFHDAHQAESKSAAVSVDGSTYILARTHGQNQSDGLRLTKYDGFGTIKWTKQMPGLNGYYYQEVKTDSTGNVFVGYTLATTGVHSEVRVAKIDKQTGGIIWTNDMSSSDSSIFTELDLDAQDNLVVLGTTFTPSIMNAIVRKISPAGATIFTKLSGGLPSVRGYDLSVSANGLIYYTARTPLGTEFYRVTPNGTSTQLGTWENYYSSWPSTYATPANVTSDRNGRAFVSEPSMTQSGFLNMRMYAPNGTLAHSASTQFADHLYSYMPPQFDGNGKVVFGTSIARPNDGFAIKAVWLTLGTNSIASVASTTIEPGASGGKLFGTRLFTDHFGQTYIAGREEVPGNVAKVWALDENRFGALWAYTDQTSQQAIHEVQGAVGRWGQVALASTLTPGYTVESANGIKQEGLRNVTINGASFTGGRTITGTVNFYSSTTANRNVALLSNTPYAKVGLSVDVPAGASQSVISVELKPTSIRRAVRIEATHNGIVRSAVFYVDPPTPAFVSVFPTTIKGGLQVNASTRLNGIAPTGGITVELSSSSPAASTPANVQIAEGQDVKAFKVNTGAVQSTTVATINATANNVTKTATLTITP